MTGDLKPPLFATPSSGSMPLDLMHRARMFRKAAIGMPDYVGPELNWPAYALMLLACELALKAVCYPPPNPRPHNHDLQGWYNLAIQQHGFPVDSQVSNLVLLFSEIHRSSYTRYPNVTGIQPRDLSKVNDMVDALIAASTAIVNVAKRS